MLLVGITWNALIGVAEESSEAMAGCPAWVGDEVASAGMGLPRAAAAFSLALRLGAAEPARSLWIWAASLAIASSVCLRISFS